MQQICIKYLLYARPWDRCLDITVQILFLALRCLLHGNEKAYMQRADAVQRPKYTVRMRDKDCRNVTTDAYFL